MYDMFTVYVWRRQIKQQMCQKKTTKEKLGCVFLLLLLYVFVIIILLQVLYLIYIYIFYILKVCSKSQIIHSI